VIVESGVLFRKVRVHSSKNGCGVEKNSDKELREYPKW
jgi:hypothetical protein